jgi:antitoxin component of MazEF toxin-antitoxin module
MKLLIRRVGNSLGVILPKSILTEWGVGEGDSLEWTKRGFAPAARRGQSHSMLDELKRSLSLAVVRRFGPPEIRAQSLANLHRWKSKGTWVSAYDDWTKIINRGTDGELFNAMLGRDDNSNRLRQSPPYGGLLSQKEVEEIYEEAGG